MASVLLEESERGMRAREIHPGRADRRIYSAFLSIDNRLFFLSAKGKQELENLTRLGLCTIYMI